MPCRFTGPQPRQSSQRLGRALATTASEAVRPLLTTGRTDREDGRVLGSQQPERGGWTTSSTSARPGGTGRPHLEQLAGRVGQQRLQGRHAACGGPWACLPWGGPESSSAPGWGQAESWEQTGLCHPRTGKCTRRPFQASTRVSATGQHLSPNGLTAWALGCVSHKPRPRQQAAQQHGPGL